MAFANWAAYLAARDAPVEQLKIQRSSSLALTAGRMFSTWLVNAIPAPGVDPGTTPATCDDTTVGGVPHFYTPANRKCIAGIDWQIKQAQWVMLYDRLAHVGGLSGATVGGTVQTFAGGASLTLPARAGLGAGVRAAVEVYSQVGTSLVGQSITYTNSAGTAGRVSPHALMGGTGLREQGAWSAIPWFGSDVGIRSVESATANGNTGTAGSYGITLYKPLVAMPVQAYPDSYRTDAILGAAGQLAEMHPDACLGLVVMGSLTSTATWGAAIIDLVEVP